jgi:hypothetical protein
MTLRFSSQSAPCPRSELEARTDRAIAIDREVDHAVGFIRFDWFDDAVDPGNQESAKEAPHRPSMPGAGSTDSKHRVCRGMTIVNIFVSPCLSRVQPSRGRPPARGRGQ